jgi:hypothetical protein
VIDVRLIALATMILVLLAPDVADACTVCGAAMDNKNQFIGMTAFLTLTPLAFIGGVLYWLKTRADALAALDE